MGAQSASRKVVFDNYTTVFARAVLEPRGKVVRIDYRVLTSIEAHRDWVREAIILACETVIYGNEIGTATQLREVEFPEKYPLVQQLPNPTFGPIESHVIDPETIKIEDDELKRKLELVIITAGIILDVDFLPIEPQV